MYKNLTFSVPSARIKAKPEWGFFIAPIGCFQS